MRLTVNFSLRPARSSTTGGGGDPAADGVGHPPTLAEGGGGADGLERELVLDATVGDGVLHVSVQAACDGDPETGEVPEHAACHLYQQDWGIPVCSRSARPTGSTSTCAESEARIPPARRAALR